MVDFKCVRKQEEGPMPTQDSPSLYERLYSIATVMEDFVDRLIFA